MKRIPTRAACSLLGLVLLPALAVAQEVGRIDRERGRTMLRQLRGEIERHYYDPAFRGVDLEARAAELETRIDTARSLAEVLASVAQLALHFGDSHTFFVPPQQTVRVDYGWQMLMVGDSTCFVARVEPGSDAAGQGVKPGDRVLSVNGYRPTRRNLWQILYLFHLLRPQPGLRVVLESPAGEQRQLDLAAEVRQRFRVADLTGADGGGDLYRLIREAQEDQRELESLVVDVGDDVLVWKLPTFAVEQRLVRDVIRRARGRKALVLDLRGNGGGPVEVLLSLLGLLHREDVAVATQHERVRQVPLVARGAGEGAFTRQLLVLVDSRSASAAEVLARVVQLTGRGVVLGDRTAGAVMRARYRQLGTGTETAVFYGVSVTDADVVMPDGGRLEVVGVEPDELVLPRAADLAAGEDPVLARALALAGISLSAAEAGALLRQR